MLKQERGNPKHRSAKGKEDKSRKADAQAQVRAQAVEERGGEGKKAGEGGEESGRRKWN